MGIKLATVIVDVNCHMIFQYCYRSTRTLFMTKAVRKAVGQFIIARCGHIYRSTTLDSRILDRGTINIHCVHDNSIWIPNAVGIKLATVIIYFNRRMIFQHRYRSARTLFMSETILKAVS